MGRGAQPRGAAQDGTCTGSRQSPEQRGKRGASLSFLPQGCGGGVVARSPLLHPAPLPAPRSGPDPAPGCWMQPPAPPHVSTLQPSFATGAVLLGIPGGPQRPQGRGHRRNPGGGFPTSTAGQGSPARSRLTQGLSPSCCQGHPAAGRVTLLSPPLQGQPSPWGQNSAPSRMPWSRHVSYTTPAPRPPLHLLLRPQPPSGHPVQPGDSPGCAGRPSRAIPSPCTSQE